MLFYKIESKATRGEIIIEADVAYKYYDVFLNPELLIKNNTFKIESGKKLLDVLHYCDPVNAAISGRFKDLLEANAVTGWSCYPIIIKGIDEPYFGFTVTGRGGEVLKFDDDGSVPIFEELEWDTSKYDGSDIFNIPDTGIWACTPEVKELCEAHKISNIEFDLL